MDLRDAPVASSAYRHGYTDADIRDAVRNFVAVAADPRDEEVTLFMGPDRNATLVEVGILSTEDGPLVIHGMAARSRRCRPRKE